MNVKPKQPLAVLGGTSHIARDFILTAHAAHGLEFALYARRPQAVAEFLHAHDLPCHWATGTLADFTEVAKQAPQAPFSGVLNFVGVGDPAKAKEMGASIYAATLESDQAAQDYLRHFSETPYIFMSSGAVYGTDFSVPADLTTAARVPINSLTPQHYYGAAKLYAEATHRSLADRSIFDIRIFNYISRSVNVQARFLITDMIDAVVKGDVFQTTDQEIVRDYLHPTDFCALVMACLRAPPNTNMPLDAYSRAPISKTDLLALFVERYGLRYEIVPRISAVDATGSKPHYYSENRAAATLGYEPRYTSAEAIQLEVDAILRTLLDG